MVCGLSIWGRAACAARPRFWFLLPSRAVLARILARGELQGGHGLGGHQRHREPFERADSQFIGREIDFARSLDVDAGAFAEVPVAEIAEATLHLAGMGAGV